MEIINPLAESYVSAHTSELDALLAEIEKQTMTAHPHAHMLSGKMQGRLLQTISQMIQPR